MQLDSIYQSPGVLLLAEADGGNRLGCVGLRSLDGASTNPDSANAGTAEIRRLFVRDQARGTGLGRRLVEGLVAHAQAMSITRLVLNTLPEMVEAQALYTSMAFEICTPYVDEPLDGVLYYERTI